MIDGLLNLLYNPIDKIINKKEREEGCRRTAYQQKK
jgi:hypothetical protein